MFTASLKHKMISSKVLLKYGYKRVSWINQEGQLTLFRDVQWNYLKIIQKRRMKERYQVDSTSCHTYGMKNSSGWLSCSYVKRNWVNIYTNIKSLGNKDNKKSDLQKPLLICLALDFFLTFKPSPRQDLQLLMITCSTFSTDQSPSILWASMRLLKKSNTYTILTSK